MSSGGPAETQPPLHAARLDAFAQRVLENLESRRPKDYDQTLREASQWLLEAAMPPRFLDLPATLQMFLRLRIPVHDAIDRCIPEAARQMGQRWLDDTASFAEVTLGSARLYALCKALDSEWRPRLRRGSGLTVLVATVPGEDHMIGPVVLASQLRRRGTSVLLLTGAPQAELVARVRRGGFDAVLMSCSGLRALDSAARLISGIRKCVKSPPRLVLGGAARADYEADYRKAGADLTTNDPETALNGLSALQRRAALRVAGA